MADLKTEYEKTYIAIKEAILIGEFTPGQKLPQRKLAQRFNATTMTVREALRTLEKENLIQIVPKWGAMVIELTKERAYEMYIVREALEGMAARLVSESISDDQANELRKQAEQCDIFLQSSSASVREKAATHEKLHRKIIILSNCGELIRCMETISLHNILLQNAYHIKFITDPPRWHSTLVNAILSNNPDNAEKNYAGTCAPGL